MSRSKNQVKSLTMMALFIAIEIVLLVTPFGYLRVGPLSATLMHIPVIVIASVMGVREGAFLGLVFGITSVINATMVPTVTSFAFSPFVTIGNVSGGFASLIVAIVPRVLLGVIAGCLNQYLLKKNVNRSLSAGVVAGVATICHTIMVLGLIYLFFAAPYSQAIGIQESALLAFFGSVLITNSLLEIVLAIIINIALSKVLVRS